MEKGKNKKSRKTRKRNKRFAGYSLAAGAALAVAGPANAAVVYSGVRNLPVNDCHSPCINLDGDGVDDFCFTAANYTYSTYYYSNVIFGIGYVAINGVTSGNSFIGSSFYNPYRLAHGKMISAEAEGTWTSYGYLNGLFCVNDLLSSPIGNFFGKKGYIGVKFLIGANTHYGWIEYEGTGGETCGDPVEGLITGWAYETVADKAIAAGDKGQTQPVSVPTLNQWGIIIFMGLVLLEGMRRFRPGRDEA